jgi:class 3 adenylate cyclase
MVNLFLWIAPHVWPPSVSCRASYRLVPLTGTYQDIVIVRNLSGRVPRGDSGDEPLKDHAENWKYEVIATLHGGKGSSVLRIDPLHKLSWERSGVGGNLVGTAPLDRAAVVAWLKDGGRDTNDQWGGYEVDELMGIFTQLQSQFDEGQGFDDLSGDVVGKIVAGWHGFPGVVTNTLVPAFNGYGENPVVGHPSDEPPLVYPILLAALFWTAGMWFWSRRLRRSNAATALTAPTGIPGTSLRADIPSAATPGAAPEVSHRLLTILFSDVKDYTTQSANQPRGGVLDIVRRHRDRVFPIVKKHHGRVVKQMGDAILATFDSATDAVLAGLEIQLTADKAQPDALQLRIAISTGEVTVEADDVFGTAVNVASRVQQLAGPGEVYFTETTRVMLNDHEVRQIEVGSFELKGVSQPVKVFRALPA